MKNNNKIVSTTKYVIGDACIKAANIHSSNCNRYVSNMSLLMALQALTHTQTHTNTLANNIYSQFNN